MIGKDINRRSQFKRGLDRDAKLKKRHEDMLSVRRNNRIGKLVTLRFGDKPIPMEKYNETNADVQRWLPKLYGKAFEEVYDAAVYFRGFLSSGMPGVIKMAIDAGIVPRLVQLCAEFNYPNLQLEAAWAITNIASGSTEETQTVVTAGAIPILVKMMNSSDEHVRKQSIWAIGNITADSSANRDLVVNTGCMPLLIKNLENPSDVSMLQIASWTLSKLVNGKDKLNYGIISPVLPCLKGCWV
jgi:hypothetical protein